MDGKNEWIKLVSIFFYLVLIVSGERNVWLIVFLISGSCVVLNSCVVIFISGWVWVIVRE